MFAPIIAEYGFTPKYELELGDREFRFYNNDGTIHISISKETFRPLKEHTLSVGYWMHKPDGTGLDFIDSSWFAPEFGLENISPCYKSQAELEPMLNQIAEATVNNVLPYLNKRFQFLVTATDEMYEFLSDKPIAQAEIFAKNHGLSMEKTIENWIRLEEILLELRGNNIMRRKESFFQNIKEIIASTAYYGELERRTRKESLQWKWILEKYDMAGVYSESRYFELCAEEGQIETLGQVINFWNGFPEITGVRIHYSLTPANSSL